MARRSKSKAKASLAQAHKNLRAQEKELRAQWRALEKMGLAKPRKRVGGKLEPLKFTKYKKAKLRKLEPVLTGEAMPVRLGPKALAAARKNNVLRAGRYAIVPPSSENVERVRAGKKPKGTIQREKKARASSGASASASAFERAVATVMAVAYRTKDVAPESKVKGQYRWQEPKESSIRKRLSSHSSKALNAIAKAPASAKTSYWRMSEWFDDWALENDYEYDDEDYPLKYH